jgi:hypothetical protein
MSSRNVPLDLPRLLRTLTEHEVDFIVIGGLAAVAHGSRRMTMDLDVIPRPTQANFDRLAQAVEALELRAETVTDGEFQELDPRDGLDLARSRNVTLRTAAGRLDVLNRAKGAPPYPDLEARSRELWIAGARARVVGLDDLITMKLALGRPRDLQDVADMSAHEVGESPPPPMDPSSG